MVANGLPLEHSFAALKASPHKALYPRATPNPANAGWRFWLFLPMLFVRAARAQARLHNLGQNLAEQLQHVVFPAWTKRIASEAARDLQCLAPDELVSGFQRWSEFVLCDMARESLKPTVLTSFLLGNLEKVVIPSLGAQGTRAALTKIMMGVHPDPDADLPKALHDMHTGRLALAEFLKRFGHRGSQEMDLAQPRWSEDPATLRYVSSTHDQAAIKHLTQQTGTPWNEIADDARLTAARRAVLERQISKLRTYLALRESAKNYFMKGYALLRRYLVELDRRYGLKGGIFYLNPEELPRLISDEDFTDVIALRRRRRSIALTIEAPSVIFSDDLDAVGRPPIPSREHVLQGVPLSVGVAEGPVLVLHEPSTRALPGEPYILVCPSTDPAWVPLFLQARGLIMETGGVLSHGAIVAREFGLPAVAGIPGVLNMLHSGQFVRLDGAVGTVTLASRAPSGAG
jgi:pyruvate,water dikinase